MMNKPIIYYKKDCFNEPYCSLGKVIEQLDQLRAENEELKRELMQYEKDVKDLNYFAIKLKQTLAEIKEICKFNFTITTTNLLAKTILQKISDCEV